MTVTHSPNVLLVGGPSELDGHRTRYVADTEEKVKVFRGHRYDHFEPTPEISVRDGQEFRVFVWTQCTYVAE
ncbi:DUF5988 family protein [Streptomyces sp. NBC_01387]|uniref:DUF5988 family protein n=1 Tax=unclassified Streptomyces TaxID=2593676 RepID=UPI00202549AB|nr:MULTISPECIES: DUF5988 family protein [unclassified Streptomyces]MCX4547610.1 DUF5988 family protein [Streptomyces sp. NBC_01500]WSC19296.1 DUF5988 family protein [Streptomyces sp. NBC_01766]WSV53319.1 DUF5988 family protein [Streptomyces sp. NBC_01014]